MAAVGNERAHVLLSAPSAARAAPSVPPAQEASLFVSRDKYSENH